MATGLSVDLATGIETYRDLDAEELAAIAQAQAEVGQFEALQAAKARQREQDLALIQARANQDPAFAALARLLGG